MEKIRAACVIGVEGHLVEVEARIDEDGPASFNIIGLSEACARETRIHVQAALAKSGLGIPDGRIAVTTTPVTPTRGVTFDLPIAVAILAAASKCAQDRLPSVLLAGELDLFGRLRPVRGLLPQLVAARDAGLTGAIVPAAQAGEASLLPGFDIRCAEHLADVVAFLDGGYVSAAGALVDARPPLAHACLSDVRGQEAAKRALEIAAAGAHSVLLIGPPGAGKTMLARRLPGLLPVSTAEEALEIAVIASAAGVGGRRPERPFRAPHHTASSVALVGGGDPIRPGEVTLAHGGVLFLDELPEFSRGAVESLRATMAAGYAMVARTRQQVTMPARPLVVAAMNPCPCGYAGVEGRLCRCSPERIDAYRARVRPLLDLFDLHVPLQSMRVADLGERGESSEVVRGRVTAARERAAAAGTAGLIAIAIAALPPAERYGLTLRSIDQIGRVAWTISHLAGADCVLAEHVAEALALTGDATAMDDEADNAGGRS